MDDECTHTCSALRQATEAANAAQADRRSLFTAVSHELRTPLTPVLLVVGMLVKRHDLPQDVYDDLEMILHNLEIEVRLIDDLLNLRQRVVEGKPVVEWPAWLPSPRQTP